MEDAEIIECLPAEIVIRVPTMTERALQRPISGLVEENGPALTQQAWKRLKPCIRHCTETQLGPNSPDREGLQEAIIGKQHSDILNLKVPVWYP